MSRRIPRHVAIIMDGNGRWAEKRGYPRIYGHIRGSARIKPIVKEADRVGIKALTLYAFSTENWCRPDLELQVLWKLLKKYLIKEVDEFDRNNVCLRAIGEIDRLAPDVRKVLDYTVDRLAGNTGLQLTLAISYGSRREFERAARLFAEDCVQNKRKPADISEAVLSNYMWTSVLGDLSDVDLVIRTGGEKRISNYLLWQSAYAEFIFTDLFWPDFKPSDLLAAVEEYSNRERRYGGLSAEAQL
ncbi:MAG: polyprenyl diphosphate synthase [Bdellovibrionota bacterium]